MNFKCCFFINVLALGLLCFSKPMLGGRLQLRPLSTDEVIRILKENGKPDAKPQGRFFTTGVAAVKGFALGLTKGVGIPLVYEFATSNSTIEFLNRLTYNGQNQPVQYETEEVCIGGDDDYDDYYDCGNDCDYGNYYYNNDYDDDYDYRKRKGRADNVNLPKDTMDTLKMKEILSSNKAGSASKVEYNDKVSSTATDSTGATQSKRKKRSKTCIIVQKPKVQSNR
ncbi:uncharacterized protein LOC119636781 [Glossina fuscipes]|uniref:Uncharacterized protein LOC119636781 n=1 Tax=Glossina fuscipes TaxID=7396 RepID=A0A9C6DRA4_9MUSC|nr:uncharacterized protein LOC119636781 [Glossina fuscipes]KAI9582592.1 hypothetical protein GQX74_011809 [Glossina fuscipes]